MNNNVSLDYTEKPISLDECLDVFGMDVNKCILAAHQDQD